MDRPTEDQSEGSREKMTDEALIESLESLRAGYQQRLRATNNVLAALKGATGALVKANRAINDYDGQRNGASSAAFTQAREAVGGLRLREEIVDPLTPELRREAKAITGLTAALRDAATALRTEPVDVVRLGHAVVVLQAAKTPDDTLAALLPALSEALTEAQRGLGDTFGAGLRDAVASLGLEIGGRPPRFEISRFEIAANFVSRRATISYGKEVLSKTIPLSVEAVVKAYQAEAKAITGRNEDPVRWMEQLHGAYALALNRRNAADGRGGARVSIIDCFYHLVLLRQAKAFRSAPSKRSFIDYSRAQFAHDFAALADRRRLRAHVATKSQADNDEKSIWIVDGSAPHDGSYIADIEFA
jgi:hypothetical protein